MVVTRLGMVERLGRGARVRWSALLISRRDSHKPLKDAFRNLANQRWCSCSQRQNTPRPRLNQASCAAAKDSSFLETGSEWNTAPRRKGKDWNYLSNGPARGFCPCFVKVLRGRSKPRSRVGPCRDKTVEYSVLLRKY